MRSRHLRYAVLALHTLLLAGLPLTAGTLGAVLALPLLLPLPGLWRGTPYVYAGFSLLLAFYVGGLLMEAVATRSAPMTLLAASTAFEFCALLLFVRMAAQERRAGLA